MHVYSKTVIHRRELLLAHGSAALAAVCGGALAAGTMTDVAAGSDCSACETLSPTACAYTCASQNTTHVMTTRAATRPGLSGKARAPATITDSTTIVP